jgi:molybdopterin molybdotransferase
MDRFEPMITLEEAFEIVDKTMAEAKPVGETVSVREALGRTAVCDQKSRLDLPPFDKSAMDGFAVPADDERDEYEILEVVPAGHVGRQPLRPGAAAKVMTGAAVPAGTGNVIMLEHAEEHGNRVKILQRDGARNICRQGEDVRAGDVILTGGTVLGPIEIANLVSCGITQIEAAKRPRVTILSTGDEIVDSPDAIAPGKIMNSNGPMLAALAEQYGMKVVTEESIPDDKGATESAIMRAVRDSDITLLSGGVSVGEFDFVLGAFEKAGLTVHFSRIAVQPGKPTVYATTSNGRAVFGLPGNPVSVFVMFHLFVLRVAARMVGANPERREFLLPLGSEVRRRKADRMAFLPAKITNEGAVETVTFHGSAHLMALMTMDGFVRIPIGVTEIAKGEEVSFLPIIRCPK